MKLYDLKAGMNPRRVRIFLAEKGVTIPRVEVDMAGGENRRAPFLTINPMGTMPVLELDDGTHLSESMAICRYIEELHPQPNLFGATPLERAQVEMWNRRMELEIMRPAQDVFLHLSPFWVGKRAGRGLRQARTENGGTAHGVARRRVGQASFYRGRPIYRGRHHRPVRTSAGQEYGYAHSRDAVPPDPLVWRGLEPANGAGLSGSSSL